MALQPKGGHTQPARGEMSLNSLVDQIVDAMRERLVQLGISSLEHPYNWQDFLKRQKSMLPPPAGDGSLASKIDHTLLKPDATRTEIEKVCAEARDNHFATVCVNSSHVALAAELLKGSQSKPIAVVGFPLGAATSTAKAFETREAIRAGAQEIDMVINIGALKSKDYAWVWTDIMQVVEAAAPYPVKVILETSSLTQDEKIIGCALAKAAGAAFVKTSTGFGSGGATVEDVALMRKIVGPEMGVKASGGVRTFEDATRMIAAGADRIGASSSVAIVRGAATGKNEPNSPKTGY
jgi:deoxyribose-phosphate aldolase